MNKTHSSDPEIIRVGQIEIRYIREAGNGCQMGCFRDTDDPVGGLTVELEVELAFRPPVIPIPESFELTAPQSPPGKCSSLHGDTHARCLAGDAAFLYSRASVQMTA